jgi:predicted site-specific integrase-resolvase
MDKLLKNEEAAKILNISPNTLNVLRSTGRGPPYLKVGGAVRYSTDDLERWIGKQSINPKNARDK